MKNIHTNCAFALILLLGLSPLLAKEKAALIETDTDFAPNSLTFDYFEYCGEAVYALTESDLLAPNKNLATISGTVFRDLNNNGTNDAGEPGQGGVIVRIFDCNGVEVLNTTTQADGTWMVDDAGVSYPIRVEFSTPQDHLQPGSRGANNTTNTVFLDAPTTGVDYGVYDPAYCMGGTDDVEGSGDVRLVTTCFVEGRIDAPGVSDVLVSYDYDDTGIGAPDVLATKSQLGSVWAVAYDRKRDDIYTAAFAKRHTGMGPNGAAAIYRYDFTSGTTSLLIDLATEGVDVSGFPGDAARNLGNPGVPTRDSLMFDRVGKISLGDIDISTDNETLYAMSLADKTVYEIDIESQTVTRTFPSAGPSCTNGEWRPFALKYHEGKLFVGGVCDAGNGGTAADLQATVYSLDLSGGVFTEVLSFPLNYRKGRVQSTAAPTLGNWRPWVERFGQLTIGYTSNSGTVRVRIYPQPILGDLEFDTDGSLILGFIDRTGHQTGPRNFSAGSNNNFLNSSNSGGDILRAAPNGSGGFVLENNGVVGTVNSGAPNNQGPGGSEFYRGEQFINTTIPRVEHEETSLGGLALIPGTDEVVLTVYNPLNGGTGQFASGGSIKLSSIDGTRPIRGKRIYSSGSDLGTFGKAAGLGDIELICAPTPIEIGNYVWLDDDNDGVQDPCEQVVPNLPVELYTRANDGSLTLVATTSTDANGEYYFTADGTAGETWVTNGDRVTPFTDYLIVFGDAGSVTSNVSINIGGTEYDVTLNGTGEGANNSLNDSDVQFTDVNGTGFPAIAYSTSDTTDHTLDAGFFPIMNPCTTAVDVQLTGSVCVSQQVDLTTGVTIVPDTSATFGATWSTDGTGMFIGADGNPLPGGTSPRFGVAVAYRPSEADIARGEVQFVLTTDDPVGVCDAVMSTPARIIIENVDCGTFPWGGN